MSTSANVTEYTIYRNGKSVGRFSKNHLCRLPDYAELLKYQPLSEHEIEAWGYDEEDEEWINERENLEKYLKDMIFNKRISDYFNGLKSLDEIIKELEEAKNQIYRGKLKGKIWNQ